MSAVFAIDACRTPIGKIKGALAGVRPDHLSADVLAALLARNSWLDPAERRRRLLGRGQSGGRGQQERGQDGGAAGRPAGRGPGRHGQPAVRLRHGGYLLGGQRAIAAGDADICIAGGAESMTRAPFVLPRPNEPFPREAGVADTRLGWRLVSPRMAKLYPPISLGETAENVADKYGIDRRAAGRVRARQPPAGRGGRRNGPVRRGDRADRCPVRAGHQRRGNQCGPDRRRPGRQEARLPSQAAL